jgi:hypothetical protein
MMKSILVAPPPFDGAKFMARYNITVNDFYVSNGLLYYPDSLPDNPILDGPDAPNIVQQNLAKDLVIAGVSASVFARAVAAVLLDELNAHADKINAILSAVDAATSLADLKTRIGLIADYPQRTLAQAKTSINNKIDSGEAD